MVQLVETMLNLHKRLWRKPSLEFILFVYSVFLVG